MTGAETDVVAEVRAAFEDYERALVANDVDAMNGWFWRDARVVRFGLADIEHGFDEIAAWRSTSDPVPSDRAVTNVVVTGFGTDAATVHCEFRNGDDPAIGRQSQTWVRTAGEGWRIVAAHDSMMP